MFHRTKPSMKVLLVHIAASWLYFASQARATGSFELQIIGIQNTRGELSNGSCCNLGDFRLDNGTCAHECRTFFRLCLKEYQSEVSDTGPCTFGNVSTAVVGGNTFSVHGDPNLNIILTLPFTFRWTVSEIFKYYILFYIIISCQYPGRA